MFSIEPLNDVTSTVSCYSFIQEKVVAKFSPLFKIMVSVREGQVDRQPQKKIQTLLAIFFLQFVYHLCRT